MERKKDFKKTMKRRKYCIFSVQKAATKLINISSNLKTITPKVSPFLSIIILTMINIIIVVIFTALPKAPGIPVVTERTATSITLTWDSGNPEPVSYYIIQHKSKYSEDLYKEIDGVATTRYSVGGLSPYSDYEFRVVAVNNIGRGPPSESIEAKTAEQAPSTAPRQVRGHMLSTTTAVIHWDEPEEANGQIMGYRVYYTMDSTQHVNMWEKQIVRGSNFVTIQGLIPNKTYYIKVLAYTSVGDGPLSPDLQIIAKTGGELFCPLLSGFPCLINVHTSQLNFVINIVQTVFLIHSSS